MKANLYKELSNKNEVVRIEAGRTVAESFPEIDFDNAVILVNGKQERKEYLLKETDILTIRQLPASSVAIAIVAIVVAVGAGIAGGIAMYKSKKAAEEAQRELDKMKKLSNRPDIDNRPFLRGASNTLATGSSQPYICGRHFFTPYLLGGNFYEISGEDGKDQYVNIPLECGFKDQYIEKIAIDDIVVMDFGKPTAQSRPQQRSFNLQSGIFAENGLVEISQNGNLFSALPAANIKTVSKACNDEIPRDETVSAGNAEYLTYTLEPNAKNVEVAVSFPYGLYKYNDDGDKESASVSITPQYSRDGGSSWINFSFGDGNSFTKNESGRELRYTAKQEFTFGDYETLAANGQSNMLLRVRSNGAKDDKTKNDCYVLYYQSQCFDAEKTYRPAGMAERPQNTAGVLTPCLLLEERERILSTMAALRVKATKINEDKLKKINVISWGFARVWENGQWSAERRPTRNAAAWALEILTSRTHELSRFSDDEIDLESFGEFHEYCAAQGFNFDHVITRNAKKGDTLNKIMENCGAALYWDLAGRLAVAIDRPQENAVAVYNAENIIGDPSNKKTFGRRTDALRIKYITSYNDLFQEETYVLMREGRTLNADSVIKDVTVTGITEHEHIVKYARRLMAIEALRPKTTTIEVGNEGVYLAPMSKILLQDDSLKIGLDSAVVKDVSYWGGKIEKITLDKEIEFPDAQCGVIVNCFANGRAVPLPLKVNGRQGKTDTLYVENNWSVANAVQPEKGCVLSFGELDSDGNFAKITTPYIISGISQTEKGFRLELVNYDEAVYQSGAIGEYKSNTTKKPSSAVPQIPQDWATRNDIKEAVSKISESLDAVHELADYVTNGVHFSNIHKIDALRREQFQRVANLDELQKKLDEVLQQGAFAVGITKDELTIEIEDTERELRSTIDIQAGSIQAMVEGGGSSGNMGLSLELPAMVTKEMLFNGDPANGIAPWIGSHTYKGTTVNITRAEIEAVYANVPGTDYCTIKGNAGPAATKSLWEKMCRAGLLASQIDLEATQIQLNANRIVVRNGNTQAAAFVGGKLQAAYIDVDQLASKIISLNSGGVLKSSNYKHGVSGFYIDTNGNAHFESALHIGGTCVIDGNTTIGGNTELENVKISGNAVIGEKARFNGIIDSGPLYLSDEGPTPTRYTFSAGKHFASEFDSNPYSDKYVIGNYNGISFNYFYTGTGGRPLYLCDKNKNELSHINPAHVGNLYENTYYNIPYDIIINVYLGNNTKTFKLRNLPTGRPSVIGAVWNDNGTLKIVT